MKISDFAADKLVSDSIETKNHVFNILMLAQEINSKLDTLITLYTMNTPGEALQLLKQKQQ